MLQELIHPDRLVHAVASTTQIKTECISGVAHVSMQDDIYKQKQIKSGTILFPNIWYRILNLLYACLT